MKISIKDSHFEIDKHTIKTTLDVVLVLEGFEKDEFQRRSPKEMIEYALVEHIVDKIKHSDWIDEMINKVDMEAIIKRVQLRIVEVSTNR